MDLLDELARAHGLRHDGQFQHAARLYSEILKAIPQHAETHHNLALCLLGMGLAPAAVVSARRALSLQAGLTPARLILAKALRLADPESLEPEQLLSPLSKQTGLLGDHARLGLSEFALNHRCDAARSAAWVRDVKADSPMAEQAGLATLSASLYERSLDDAGLSQMVIDYARQFIDQSKAVDVQPRDPPSSARISRQRPRILILSCALKAGPIFSMGFDSLQALAGRADLVFFHRGQKQDEATDAFKSLATSWVDCWQWDWRRLFQALQDERGDALLEMSGWMDPDGLKAVSVGPAARQYKWIGGQSVTTGLTCFDGYLGDEAQCPPGCESLYVEPIIRLRPSYAGFRWPIGQKPGVTAKRSQSCGIVGNPTKISTELPSLLETWFQQSQITEEIRFIDRKYQRAAVRERIESLLDQTRFKPVFEIPDDQHDYYRRVTRLSGVIDTRPYSAGLTAREALNLGVRLITQPESHLFSARHGVSARQSPLGQGGIDLFEGLGLKKG